MSKLYMVCPYGALAPGEGKPHLPPQLQRLTGLLKPCTDLWQHMNHSVVLDFFLLFRERE